MDKAGLRAEMRRRRKAFAAASPQAASRLADHADAVLAALFPDRAPSSLTAALYRAQGAELDPLQLGHAWRSAGVQLALPVTVAADAPLVFRRWTPGQALAPDFAGVPAPLSDAREVTSDLILLPLLAFDRLGGRLGQGGGFYDRTLEALRSRQPRPWFVGLAYAGQEVERLPREGHDQPLDGVLTEVGYSPSRKDS